MKTTDVAPELRQFNKVFSKLGNYKYDEYTVFADFLKYTIYAFNSERTNQDMEWYENLKRRYEKDYSVFPELFKELVLTYNRQINDAQGSWYDPLGDFYMQLASKSKASAFGQFFTPAHIVDFMVQVSEPPQGFEEAKGKGYTVNDPTCGSARMLLAYHALAPGNFMFGDDLDEICVNMSVVNMVFHGCIGQVRHMDSISGKFFGGYAINPHLAKHGLISVRRLLSKNDDSWLISQPNYVYVEKEEPKQIEIEKEVAPTIIFEKQTKKETTKQLSLW